MKKRSLIPETRVKNPEPKKYNEDWIIWAGWADRITFEEIAVSYTHLTLPTNREV